MKKIFALLLTLSIAACLIACDDSKADITVSLIIDGLEDETFCGDIVLKDEDSAFDAIKASGVEYEIDGSSVKSIGELSDGQCGENSHWLYEVNGEQPEVTGDEYKLHDGDSLHWLYIFDEGSVGME